MKTSKLVKFVSACSFVVLGLVGCNKPPSEEDYCKAMVDNTAKCAEKAAPGAKFDDAAKKAAMDACKTAYKVAADNKETAKFMAKQLECYKTDKCGADLATCMTDAVK